jgi:GT2 family glycosyltransferase
MVSPSELSRLSTPSPVVVSIIIVNWNTRDLLYNCLLSVQAQTVVPHEIIVIDNASTDSSAQMAGRDFPAAIIIANSHNRGFAAANNQGLAVARGDYILLLNPDTVVLDGAIDRMLDWIAKTADVGCVGCQVLEAPGVIQRTCFSDPSPFNQMIVEFGLMQLTRWIPAFGRPWYVGWDRTTIRDVDVVSGMFMLVPRHVLNKVGPLDEAFFVYAEEADWCRRIRKVGFRCMFAPVAQILHLDGGSKSTAQIRSRMYVQMQKSHLIYARKHSGFLGYLFAKSVLMVSGLLRFGLFGLVGLIRKDANTKARVRLSAAALRYHLTGAEPTS